MHKGPLKWVHSKHPNQSTKMYREGLQLGLGLASLLTRSLRRMSSCCHIAQCVYTFSLSQRGECCAGNQVFYIHLPSIQQRTVSVQLAEQLTQSWLKVETTTSTSVKTLHSGSKKKGFATRPDVCNRWHQSNHLLCKHHDWSSISNLNCSWFGLWTFERAAWFVLICNFLPSKCGPTAISRIHFVLSWTKKNTFLCTIFGSRSQSEFCLSVSSCAEMLIQMLSIRDFFQKPVDWVIGDLE